MARRQVGCAGRVSAPALSCVIHAARSPAVGVRRLCVRPEWVSLVEPRSTNIEQAEAGARAKVTAVRFQGPHTDYQLATPAGTILARQAGSARSTVGDRLEWRLDAVAAV